VPALAASLWITTLVFALRAFTPEQDIVLPFNSDDAISVIMANQTAVTPYHLFYFGQDRYGAWPHLTLAAASRLIGTITPAAFSHAQVLWAWLGAIPLWRLAGVFAPGALVAYLWAFTLAPPLVGTLFSGQPYTWQIAGLLWAWWMLRRVARASRPSAVLALGAFVAALLPMWISRASVPMLVAIAVLEALSARGAGKEGSTANVAPALIVIAAAIGESLLRTLHGRYALEHFGNDFATPVVTDRGFYLRNVGAALAQVIALPPGALSIVAVLFGVGALVFWGVARLRRRPPGEWDEWALLGGGFTIVVTVQVGIAVVVTWVRLNGYNPRYFVLCAVFAALIIGILVSALAHRLASGAQALVLAAGLAWFLHGHPVAHPAPDFSIDRRAGLALGRTHPGAILLGDYWGTYLIAGAAPEAGLRPVAFHNDRMPWLDGAFRKSDLVVASFLYTDRFGTSQDPTRLVAHRGQVFALVRTFMADALPFALYRRRTDARASVHIDQGEAGAAALFDGRADTTFSPRDLIIRYACGEPSTIDVLGSSATLEWWRSGNWVSLAATRPRHWQLPAATAGDLRLRLNGTSALSEVVVLCGERGKEAAE
jgi:hypothetical protein